MQSEPISQRAGIATILIRGRVADDQGRHARTVTLGETGGDLLASTLRVGYLISTAIFLTAFLVAHLFTEPPAHRNNPTATW